MTDSPRDKIRAELLTARLKDWTDEEHLAMLRGYRDHHASEWHQKLVTGSGRGPGPMELDRQQAMVFSWAIEQIAPGTPLDYHNES